jgi:hypothetical protein
VLARDGDLDEGPGPLALSTGTSCSSGTCRTTKAGTVLTSLVRFDGDLDDAKTGDRTGTLGTVVPGQVRFALP